MRRKYGVLLSLAMIATLGTAPACADSLPEVAVGPFITSSGLGAEVMANLVPGRLNLAFGFGSWGVHDKMDIAGTQFWGKARLGAVPLYLAWYPFRNAFNLQGGVFFNLNRLSVLCMVPTGGSVRIAHHTYTAAELGNVSGATKFNAVAPYLGIGFGQPFRGGKWGFIGSLGVFYEGRPDLRLNASNPAALLLPGVTARVATDQDKINHYASMADFYPVLSVGVIYRF
jgi:hypothetical protein